VNDIFAFNELSMMHIKIRRYISLSTTAGRVSSVSVSVCVACRECNGASVETSPCRDGADRRCTRQYTSNIHVTSCDNGKCTVTAIGRYVTSVVKHYRSTGVHV